MPFDMYSDVILTRDVAERGLRTGDVGTVVELHAVPGVSEEAYSVEFFDMTGNSVAVVTLPSSALRLPYASRLACRASSQRLSVQLSRRTAGCHIGEPARNRHRKWRVARATDLVMQVFTRGIGMWPAQDVTRRVGMLHVPGSSPDGP